eukprot:3256320-Rhodomonas_salina.5
MQQPRRSRAGAFGIRGEAACRRVSHLVRMWMNMSGLPSAAVSVNGVYPLTLSVVRLESAPFAISQSTASCLNTPADPHQPPHSTASRRCSSDTVSRCEVARRKTTLKSL